MEASLVPPGWVERGEASALRDRFLPMRLERWLIRIGLLLSALGAVVAALVLLALSTFDGPLDLTAPPGPIEVPTDPVWYALLLAVAVVAGVVSAVALAMSFTGHEARAMKVATAAALIDLVAGGLADFYVSQFGAAVSVLTTLVLLLLIHDYRGRLAANARRRDPQVDEAAAPPLPA